MSSSVDVIIPCYKYGRFLRQCVESVIAQEGVEVRVLILDDASPDETSEVATELARQDPRVAYVRHATNRGHILTYNEGIEWASSDYLLILSADDYLLPNALRWSATLMDKHPEIGFTFGKAIEWRDGSELKTAEGIGSNAVPEWQVISGLEFINLTGHKNIVRTPTAVVRRELQQRLGGYRPELRHSGDMDMWLRFAAHGSVGILRAYQAIYRRHSSNMSSGYSWLPDLQQRKAALDGFFETCSDLLPSPRELRRNLLFSLAIESVQQASEAFNNGEIEISEQLADFAAAVDPRMKYSMPWFKFRLKSHLGYAAWSFLQQVTQGHMQEQKSSNTANKSTFSSVSQHGLRAPAPRLTPAPIKEKQ